MQTTCGQQILLVTNPAQLMALQQLALQQQQEQQDDEPDQCLGLERGTELSQDDVVITAAALDDD